MGSGKQAQGPIGTHRERKQSKAYGDLMGWKIGGGTAASLRLVIRVNYHGGSAVVIMSKWCLK